MVINGSGKTMLMRAVSGLMYPTSGTIKIDGKVLGRDMAFPQKIGLLIENIFDMCDKGCLILLSSHIELWSKPEALDEQQQQIREVMDKLPAKYYSVVNCMVVKELSVKETAKELSISEDNVRKRFERAKLLLKTIMKGCGGYEESRAV